MIEPASNSNRTNTSKKLVFYYFYYFIEFFFLVPSSAGAAAALLVAAAAARWGEEGKEEGEGEEGRRAAPEGPHRPRPTGRWAVPAGGQRRQAATAAPFPGRAERNAENGLEDPGSL